MFFAWPGWGKALGLQQCDVTFLVCLLGVSCVLACWPARLVAGCSLHAALGSLGMLDLVFPAGSSTRRHLDHRCDGLLLLPQETGMTLEEVKGILGEPTEENAAGIGDMSAGGYVWKDGDKTITVTFMNEKVTVMTKTGF